MTDAAREVQVGTVAVDADSEDDDRLYVVAVHDDTAADWTISALGETVAAVNPTYPETDRVVSCVYREDAVDELGDAPTTGVLRAAAAQGDLRTYTFPRSRLRVVGQLGGDPA